jgi:cytidine deaminase
MKTLEFQLKIEEYQQQELPKEDQQLLENALEAAKMAYAPYSEFGVGAAIILEDGTVITGNNQENATYPSGLCAERVAFFHAGAVHPGKRIVAIAVRASSLKYKTDQPIAPCGGCLQVMLESEKLQGSPIRLLTAGSSGSVYTVSSVGHLLPFQFDLLKLKP